MRSLVFRTARPVAVALAALLVAPPAFAREIRCESRNYRYACCRVDTYGDVRLRHEGAPPMTKIYWLKVGLVRGRLDLRAVSGDRDGRRAHRLRGGRHPPARRRPGRHAAARADLVPEPARRPAGRPFRRDRDRPVDHPTRARLQPLDPARRVVRAAAGQPREGRGSPHGGRLRPSRDHDRCESRRDRRGRRAQGLPEGHDPGVRRRGRGRDIADLDHDFGQPLEGGAAPEVLGLAVAGVWPPPWRSRACSGTSTT